MIGAARVALLFGVLGIAFFAPSGRGLAWGAGTGTDHPLYLSDCVEPRPSYPGILKASDVCMRSLRPRPINSSDPYDTLEAIRGFHVTRLEWTYGLTKDFIAKVEDLGCTASGAVANGSLKGVSRDGDDWFLKLNALDLNGKAVEAPWMRAWPGHALWHCVNNPAAREAYLDYVKDQIDQGVQDLQRDDPTMNYHATQWGGCFCKYCMTGFRDYLGRHATDETLRRCGIEDVQQFDYAEYLRARNAPSGDDFAKYPEDDLKRLFLEFQEQSTIEFHRWWRKELNEYAGRYVPVSSNNGATHFGPIHSLFDCYIGELSYSRAQPESLYDLSRQVEQLGKGQTVTMPLRRDAEETREWIDTTRRTIATAYALGMHIEAPWDTYLPVRDATHPPRYFGKPEDFSDLFAMVRAKRELLDGYELAAATGGMIDEDRWTPEASPVSVWSRSTRVIAVSRALPAQQDAPVAVHLIDWSETPQSFTVSLNPDSLFAGRPLRISLVTPKPYERASHDAAFDSDDYASLVTETPVAAGRVTTFEIPPLRPWGILIVKPQADTPGLWPPRFVAQDRQGAPAIGISGCENGVSVHYTTDGTAPDLNSPVYESPILVESCTELRACACLDGESSAVSVLSHLPAADRLAKSLLVNGDFSAGTAGWRSVVSREIGVDGAMKFVVEQPADGKSFREAHLQVNASDGVAYHLRLTQPVRVKHAANLYVTATLRASRPTRVRLGIQERSAPYRAVHVGIVEIDSEPRRLRLSMSNSHPELEAQLQLDLGYCQPDTSVWLSDVTVLELGADSGL